MDGELTPLTIDADTTDAVARQRAPAARAPADRPAHTMRWLLIVGVLLAAVLGGLYGFNRSRSQAIATFFANNKPPPAQDAAVTATSAARARFATRIRALAAP